MPTYEYKCPAGHLFEKFFPMMHDKRREKCPTIGMSTLPEFKYETPRDPAHGDGATNLALVIAQALGKSPRAVAEQLVGALQLPAGIVKKVEIAGPGFINFFLAEEQLAAVLP